MRSPEVVEAATLGPVEILLGGGAGSLVLMPAHVMAAQREVKQLALAYLRAELELRRPNPSPVVLGDVAYIANWSPEEQARFMAGFAEALAESFRTDDPVPARSFVDLMASADVITSRPDQTGTVSPDAQRYLAERLA